MLDLMARAALWLLTLPYYLVAFGMACAEALFVFVLSLWYGDANFGG